MIFHHQSPYFLSELKSCRYSATAAVSAGAGVVAGAGASEPVVSAGATVSTGTTVETLAVLLAANTLLTDTITKAAIAANTNFFIIVLF